MTASALVAAPGPPSGAAGLTDAEVAERVRDGRVNTAPPRTTRTVPQILRANILTRFNAILGALLVVILVVGPLQDALFGFVLVANSAVGVVQELRAKRTLDRLLVVTAPRARVVRRSGMTLLPAAEVVQDDLLELTPGDQVVVDAVVSSVDGLEVDESLLTGESEPVHKRPGELVLSGSFVAAGSGRAVAARVGADSYSARLTAEARRFTLVPSELQAGINTILRLITWLIGPIAALLVTTQLLREDSLHDAAAGSVAGIVMMVPEGLVLLTSVAFAVGVVRLARQRVLVQQLPALEVLARVDVVCADKTGTLTTGGLRLHAVEPLDGRAVDGPLGAVVHVDAHPNASARALRDAVVAPADWQARTTVPFSSARKWSGADYGEHGRWVLGAPDVLLAASDRELLRRVETHAAAGRRVLLLAEASGPLGDGARPPHVVPAALVVLADEVRVEAADTLRYFSDEGVAVKILSGDHPRTVATIAAALGLPGADDPVDARSLPDEPAALADIVERHSVFGRVTPQQKRVFVAALQHRGHVVAMTGDGVNDVLALKDADLGIAMGSGTGAARGVSEVVLLDDDFSALPHVVAEGRRVLGNVERVAHLFLTKTAYATVLAVAIGVAALPFPFLPRHLTLVSSLTIGIPGFFLALAPNTARNRPGFVPRVLRFAIPAGVVVAVATFGAYVAVRDLPGVTLAESRTVATTVLFGVGLWILTLLARPATSWRRLLVAGMVAGYGLVLAVAPLRTFFALDLPGVPELAIAAAVVVVADLLLEVAWRTMLRHGVGPGASVEPKRLGVRT